MLFNFLFFVVAITTYNLLATTTDFFLHKEVSAFWTVTANWFIPGSKLTFWVTIATIEDTIALGFAFDDLSLMAAWTLDTNLLNNRLRVTAVWEIATSIEFTKTT